MKNGVTVQDIIDKFHFDILAGKKGIQNKIVSEELQRPGLELIGVTDIVNNYRIEIIGKQESFYLSHINKKERESQIDQYVQKRPPCIIVANEIDSSEYFKKACDKYNVPLLRTLNKTTNVISELNNYLEKEFAQIQGIHAVCVNVFGVGILIRGESGIGKSEIALELITKGHRLISDDIVILKKIGPEALIGTHNINNRNFLSIRGIGLVDVSMLYGTGAYQDETKINLEIFISPWESGKDYDTLGNASKKINYMGIEIEQIEIPVSPGRNLATIIELAAKNWRIKREGYDVLEEFEKRIREEK